MIKGLIILAVIIVLCILLYIQTKREEELLDVFDKLRGAIIELDERVKKLEIQDFS